MFAVRNGPVRLRMSNRHVRSPTRCTFVDRFCREPLVQLATPKTIFAYGDRSRTGGPDWPPAVTDRAHIGVDRSRRQISAQTQFWRPQQRWSYGEFSQIV